MAVAICATGTTLDKGDGALHISRHGPSTMAPQDHCSGTENEPQPIGREPFCRPEGRMVHKRTERPHSERRARRNRATLAGVSSMALPAEGRWRAAYGRCAGRLGPATALASVGRGERDRRQRNLFSRVAAARLTQKKRPPPAWEAASLSGRKDKKSARIRHIGRREPLPSCHCCPGMPSCSASGWLRSARKKPLQLAYDH